MEQVRLHAVVCVHLVKSLAEKDPLVMEQVRSLCLNVHCTHSTSVGPATHPFFCILLLSPSTHTREDIEHLCIHASSLFALLKA